MKQKEKLGEGSRRQGENQLLSSTTWRVDIEKTKQGISWRCITKSTRANEHNLQQGELELDIRKNLHSEVGQTLQQVSREAMGSRSLQTLKT